MTNSETAACADIDGHAAVVRQDLDNVLHRVVAHRQLEAEPLVIASRLKCGNSPAD